MDKRSESSVVASVLRRAGLSNLADLFHAHDIDDDVIDALTDDDLREIGLTLGQRRKFAKARDQIQAASAPHASAQAESAADSYEALKVRRMTILFCDLVGSTALARRLAPDELYEILQSYYAVVSAVTSRFGGFVATLQGDGIAVLFGYPRTSSANAERAVGAALALISEIAQLRHRLHDGSEVQIDARIGIATGSTVVGRTREGFLTEEIHTVGPIPNLAARLQGHAETGWVLTDEATKNLAEHAFVFESLPNVDLKGFEERITVARALASRKGSDTEALAISGARVQAGRRDELLYLLDCWARAKSGTSRIVHIWGSAGLGKSELIARVRDKVGSEKGRCLVFNCAPSTSHVPLGPLRARLEAFVGHAQDSAPAARMAALRHLLREQSQDDIDRISDLLDIPGDRNFSKNETSAASRMALMDSLIRWLLSGTDRPTLIVIENTQWADPTTVELFNRFRDAMLRRRVLIVATSREPERQIWAGDRAVEAFELEPLPHAEASEILDAHLDGRVLPDEMRRAILSRSDGNPLMIEEMLKASETPSGDSIAFDWRVPPSLYDSIAERIDALVTGRAVASAASVFGRQAPAQVLAEVLQMPADDLDEACRHLRSVGVFEPRRIGASDTLAFRHAHVRDVLYEGLTATMRRQLHAKISEALPREDPGLAETRPELLAWHAYEGQDFATAAPLLLRTGERAAERSALSEAIHYLDLALAALAEVPADAPGRRLKLQALTALTAVKRARLGIAVPEVGELSEQLYDLAVDLGDARTELIALNGLYAYYLVKADFRGAKIWGDRLLATARRTGNATFEMIGLRASGVVALHTGSLTPALELLEDAIGRYDVDRHAHLAHVHGYDHAEICSAFLSYTHWMIGDLTAAWQASIASVDHAEAIDHPHSMAQALAFRAMLALLARNPVVTEDAATRAINIAERYSLKFMEGPARFFREASTILSSGGAGSVDRLLSIHDGMLSLSPDNYGPLIRTTAGFCMLARDDADRAAEFADMADAAQERTGEIWTAPEVLRLRAAIHRTLGAPDLAASVLLEGVEKARRQGAVMFEARLACDLAELGVQDAHRFVSDAVARILSTDNGWDVERAAAHGARVVDACT